METPAHYLLGASISYTAEGRAGQVHFKGLDAQFSLDYEFGSGDCVAYLHIPRAEYWEAMTSIPAAQRDEVLRFIAQEVVRKQTSSGYFEIEESFINIYR